MRTLARFVVAPSTSARVREERDGQEGGIEDGGVSAVEVRRAPSSAQMREKSSERSALERPRGPLERHTVTSVTRAIDLVLESLEKGDLARSRALLLEAANIAH